MSLGMLINVLATNLDTGKVCEGLSPFLTLVGYVVTIIKVVIPLLLIIFGMLDVGKSVVASKPDEVNKSLKSFAMRCIAAVLIFFIPSIVGVLLDAVYQTGETDASGWRCCWEYVINPTKASTSDACQVKSNTTNR